MQDANNPTAPCFLRGTTQPQLLPETNQRIEEPTIEQGAAPVKPGRSLSGSMTIHVGLSIRGALKFNTRELGMMFRKLDGRGYISADDAKKHLEEHLAAGRLYLPIGPICEGFSYQSGCPGHRVEGEA